MRLKIIALLISFCVCWSVFAQERTDVTVEEKYLSAVEDVVIAELSNADNRDNQIVALQYIEKALDGERRTEAMQAALETLAGQGVLTQSRTGGRLVNNFPDVRIKACELMGRMGTEKAKDMLLKVTLNDNEPTVVATAIKSMGDINIINNDDVVNVIEGVQKKFAALNPTSSLALEVVNTLEKIAPNVKNKSVIVSILADISVNYNYVTPVRSKALALFYKLAESTN